MGREVDGRVIERGDGRRPARAGRPSSRRSPTTAPSSCVASRTCCSTDRACPRPRPGSPAAPWSSWSPATSTAPSCAAIQAFLREQNPVLIGVDRGADVLLRGRASGPTSWSCGRRVEDSDRPSAKALRGARDVVVRVDRGGRGHTDQLERLGVRPLARRDRRHHRGRRAAAGRRRRRVRDRRRRHARHARRVPRPPAVRPGQHLPDPAQGRARGWSTPRAVPTALRRPGATAAPAARAAGRADRAGRRHRHHPGRPGVGRPARPGSSPT